MIGEQVKPTWVPGLGAGMPINPNIWETVVLEDCYEISPSMFSSHWRQRENPHALNAVTAVDAARVALAALADVKGRNGTG